MKQPYIASLAKSRQNDDLPTAAELRVAFAYDVATGELTHRDRGGHLSRFAGRPAGKVDRHGSLLVSYKGRLYIGHRLIWARYYDEWPKVQIAHISGDPFDNRISNLRECMGAQIAQNRASLPSSASRYVGVTWHKKLGKWQAQIQSAGRYFYLGVFDCERAAHDAYLTAKATPHAFQPIPREAL